MMMMMMNCFIAWLIEERRLALFPAGSIVRDPHHREDRPRGRFEPAENLTTVLFK